MFISFCAQVAFDISEGGFLICSGVGEAHEDAAVLVVGLEVGDTECVSVYSGQTSVEAGEQGFLAKEADIMTEAVNKIVSRIVQLSCNCGYGLPSSKLNWKDRVDKEPCLTRAQAGLSQLSAKDGTDIHCTQSLTMTGADSVCRRLRYVIRAGINLLL